VSGTLTAEFDGPNVKLTMEFASDDYAHSFMVEKFSGTDTDANGNVVEVWEAIHTGTRKFVQGEADYHMAYLPEGHPDAPFARVPGQKTTYRALAYRDADPDANVTILHTHGTYTDAVSI